MDEKVVLAALDEMKIHSLRFTMDDLTRRLRMSKTSLYKIVDSKEKLIHEVVSYLMLKFDEAEKNILITDGSREKVILFVDEYTRMFSFLENRIYDDLRIGYSSEWQRCEEFRRQKIDVLLNFLDEGMKSGEFRQINSAVLQHCLLSMSSILANTKFLSANDLTYSQAIENMRDLMFYGILKR